MHRPATCTPKAYREAQVTRVCTAMRLNDGESAQLLATLCANQQLLRDLMLRYNMGRTPVATLCKRGVAPTIRSPQDAWHLFGEEMSCLVQEQLRVLLLDTKHGLMRWEIVYRRTVDAIIMRPAELLRPAVLTNATAIVVHNHPSGDPDPLARRHTGN